ncbi:MAG: dTDP-4-dehydrorhamnose reductase [Lachnospiraceae bacterium]
MKYNDKIIEEINNRIEVFMKKRIIITGFKGQLGIALNQVYKNYDKEIEIINTDVEELDITDEAKVVAFVKEMKPFAIINCAAYTAVDACEVNQEIAYKINAIGPKNLSIAANEVGAKLVHVSTDYVFDGTKDGAYIESDPTNPQSIYGHTKEAGEKFVMENCKEYFIVRTAWLYGEGKNFVKTMLRIAENNKKVRVVKDQIGTPTSAMELARAIVSLLSTTHYGIYHGTCEGQCSWADFAKKIFELAKLEIEVEPITTKEYIMDYPNQAKRPTNSVLENKKLKEINGYEFATWEVAIKEYMQ